MEEIKTTQEYYKFHMDKLREFHKKLSKIDFDTEDNMKKYMNSQVGMSVYNECDKNNINIHNQQLDYALSQIYDGYKELSKIATLQKEDNEGVCKDLRALFVDLDTRKIFVELMDEKLAENIKDELLRISSGIEIKNYKDVIHQLVIRRVANGLQSAHEYGVMLVLEELIKACDDVYYSVKGQRIEKRICFVDYVKELIQIDNALRTRQYLLSKRIGNKEMFRGIQDDLDERLDTLRSLRNQILLEYSLDAYNFHNYIHGGNAKMMRLVESSFKHVSSVIDDKGRGIGILSDFVRELKNL